MVDIDGILQDVKGQDGVWELSDDHKKQLSRDGFCVVPDCIGQSLIEALVKECEVRDDM
jgi:hypothetical protein